MNLADLLFGPIDPSTSILDESSKDDQAKAFKKDLAKNNHELHIDLERQAKLAIAAVRNGYNPREKVDALRTLFHWNKEMDPTESADTYGVRAFITALSKNKKEAGKAKRFYDRTIDALFKDLYNEKGKSEEEDDLEGERQEDELRSVVSDPSQPDDQVPPSVDPKYVREVPRSPESEVPLRQTF